MTQEIGLDRQKDIARRVLVARLIERGLPGRRELMKDLSDAAKAAGTETEEMVAMYRDLLPEIIAGIFGLSNVKISYTRTIEAPTT